MAAGFVRAVAPERKVGLAGQGGKHVQGRTFVRGGHFAAVFRHEALPVSRGFCRQCQFNESRRRCQCGEPDVEVVLRRVLAFDDSARRPPDRSDSKSFAGQARSAETDDSNGHDRVPGNVIATTGTASVMDSLPLVNQALLGEWAYTDALPTQRSPVEVQHG
jgi:hypothetical protein